MNRKLAATLVGLSFLTVALLPGCSAGARGTDVPAGAEDSTAASVQLLQRWRVEVLQSGSEGSDAILGYGLTWGEAEEAYLYSTGEPLRSYGLTADDVKVGDHSVRILRVGGTLLGVKREPSAVVQSAVAPSGAFALVTTGKEVALVRSQGLQLISPTSYQGTDLAQWGQGLSQVSLFSSPVVSDARAFALRVMVPDEKGATVVSVWRGDIDSKQLHPVLVGKEGDANAIAGFLPDGRLVVWDLGLGVLAVDAEGNVSHVGDPDLTAESVSSKGLILVTDRSLRPYVLASDSVTLPLEGLPDGAVFSYGGAWTPDGTRAAFLAGTPNAAASLVVAQVDGGSFRVIDAYTPPDSVSTFIVGGPIGWANDSEVVAFTQGSDGDKTWVFRVGGGTSGLAR